MVARNNLLLHQESKKWITESSEKAGGSVRVVRYGERSVRQSRNEWIHRESFGIESGNIAESHSGAIF